MHYCPLSKFQHGRFKLHRDRSQHNYVPVAPKTNDHSKFCPGYDHVELPHKFNANILVSAANYPTTMLPLTAKQIASSFFKKNK